MKNLVLGLAAGALFICANNAQADNQLNFRIQAIIPVKCDYGLTGHNAGSGVLSLSVKRDCNTRHNVLIRNLSADRNFRINYLGKMQTVIAGETLSLPSGPVFNQSEQILVSDEAGLKEPAMANLSLDIQPL